jgi:metal-responsive CopG/Arc/MetJ family transcriptional regulator
MVRTVKTAVSLPVETFAHAEQIRKKNGKSRSELYADALKDYFRQLEIREIEARYAAGYKAKPENLAEISAGARAGFKVLAKEDW